MGNPHRRREPMQYIGCGSLLPRLEQLVVVWLRDRPGTARLAQSARLDYASALAWG